MTQSPPRALAYGRSPSDLLIFISSTLSDDSLLPDRGAAAEALRMLRISTPWMWEEDAVATPRAPHEIYIETARASDGLILIIGATLTKATQAEYEAAVTAGVPCFVFLKDVPRDREATEFVASIRDTHVFKQYGTSEELRTQVLDAIQQHLVWSWHSARRMTGEIQFATTTGSLDPTTPNRSRSASTDRVTGATLDIDGLKDAVLPGFRGLSASERAAAASALLDQSTMVESHEIARFAMDELIPLVPESELTPSEVAWLANSKGLGLILLGDYEAAADELNRSRQIGQSESDTQLAGVALQNLSILEHRQENITRAEQLARQSIEAFLESGDRRRAAGVKLNLASILEADGRIDAALGLLSDIEELARSLGDWSLLAYVNGALGLAQARKGEFSLAESLLRRSLRSGKKRQDPMTELLARYNLGTLYLHSERYRRAIRWYSGALTLTRELGARSKEGDLHRAMAEAYRLDGRAGHARSHLQLALAAFELIEDQRSIGTTANDLGALHLQLGDFDAAELAFREALAAFVLCSDREGQSQVLQNLALVRYENEMIWEALQSLDQALVLTTEISVRADIREQKAQIALRSAATRSQASDFFRQMLLTRADHLAADELAWAYGQAAHSLSEAGLTSDATELFDEGTRIARENGHSETAFHLMNDKGVALADAGDPDSARSVFLECLASEDCSSNRPLAQQALYNLGETMRRVGDLEDALPPTKQAVKLAEELDDRQALAESLCNLGTLYVDMEELDAASGAFEEGLLVAIADGDRESEARLLSGIGNVAYLRDQFAEAYEYYLRSAQLHREVRKNDDYIASLGAATEALALQGRDGLQEHFQYLIDEAQKKHREELASETFARIGRRYLDGGYLDDAVDCFAIAVIAGAVSTRRADEPDAFIEGFLKAVALVTTQLLLSPRNDISELITSIETELAGTYQLPASVLRDAFHRSVEVLSDVAPEG